MDLQKEIEKRIEDRLTDITALHDMQVQELKKDLTKIALEVMQGGWISVERRADCSEFEPKRRISETGMCETDGHYLCGGCKHIAPFNKMEIQDNREKYYPKDFEISQLKEKVNELIELLKDEVLRDDNEDEFETIGVLKYDHENQTEAYSITEAHQAEKWETYCKEHRITPTK